MGDGVVVRSFLPLVTVFALVLGAVGPAQAYTAPYTVSGQSKLSLMHGHSAATTYTAKNADGSVVSDCTNQVGGTNCVALIWSSQTNPPTGTGTAALVDGNGVIHFGKNYGVLEDTSGWTTGTWYIRVQFPVYWSTLTAQPGAVDFITTVDVHN